MAALKVTYKDPPVAEVAGTESAHAHCQAAEPRV